MPTLMQELRNYLETKRAGEPVAEAGLYGVETGLKAALTNSENLITILEQATRNIKWLAKELQVEISKSGPHQGAAALTFIESAQDTLSTLEVRIKQAAQKYVLALRDVQG
jgi:hypothetical protein